MWLNVYWKATTSEMNSTDKGSDSSSWVDILKDNGVLCVTGNQLLSCGCFISRSIPKNPDPSKVAILRTYTPLQNRFKPLHWRVQGWTCFSPTDPNRRFSSGSPFFAHGQEGHVIVVTARQHPGARGLSHPKIISWDFFEVYSWSNYSDLTRPHPTW